MKKLAFIIYLFLVNFGTPLIGQSFQAYNWPQEALISGHYRVFVQAGNEPEQEVKVLQSNASWEGDWRGNELRGRTFSYAKLSNSSDTTTLHFRIIKDFGTNATQVGIAPRKLQVNTNFDGAREVQFSIRGDAHYFSVHFQSTDNQTGNHKWIKHMLCIFVDPPEEDVPNPQDEGVVVLSPGVSGAQLMNASTIYVPAGYHNWQDYAGTGNIDGDGVLELQDQQSLYIQGGAFVEGLIGRADWNNTNQRVYGRGVLSGRQFLWHNHPDHTGTRHGEILELGKDAQIEGITIIDSPNHGIVGRNVDVKYVQLIGWHSNNDGIRVGSGSEISHSFLRPVDDHFYNFDIWVHDVVLWAGHNGAVMTYGWGGLEGDNTYNSGSSLMEDVSIIHPEWINLGNNNGLIMAQVGLDYKPYNYGSSTFTIIRNIEIEGKIPGLTNLKPRTGGSGGVLAVKVPFSEVGYLGDLILDNINVDGQFDKGRIEGVAQASTSGSRAWEIKNVRFRDISIGGNCVTESNKSDFFNIDENTINNLSFSCTNVTSTDDIQQQQLQFYPNPTTGIVYIKGLSKPTVISIYNSLGKKITTSSTTGQINMQAYPKGIYLIRIAGHQLYRIVKTK